MQIDVLVAEIGSTTTVINAFDKINTADVTFLGQGQAATTVLEGDVSIGLKHALNSLENELGVKNIRYKKMLATSSAAGGLKMTVHGLVEEMTAKAAKEAALGAGAVIKYLTSGKLTDEDLNEILKIMPNIILLAGGVDYGERETALYNAERLLSLNLKVPVIYAGNIEMKEEIEYIFKDSKYKLYLSENVYPKMDILNVEPTRKIIQKVFEEHIIKAAGMENIRKMVNGQIIPTPGSVMEAAKVLYEDIGDLLVIDVGGATTDIHSISEGTDAIDKISISPEPLNKRTVEGDLGLFVNAGKVIEYIGKLLIEEELKINLDDIMKTYQAIPKDKDEIKLAERLAKEAVRIAIKRHAGRLINVRTAKGNEKAAEGKDLTAVKYIVATGGALTRLPHRLEILKHANKNDAENSMLLPKAGVEYLIDNDYIMASLGVLSLDHKEDALRLMKKSFKI